MGDHPARFSVIGLRAISGSWVCCEQNPGQQMTPRRAGTLATLPKDWHAPPNPKPFHPHAGDHAGGTFGAMSIHGPRGTGERFRFLHADLGRG